MKKRIVSMVLGIVMILLLFSQTAICSRRSEIPNKGLSIYNGYYYFDIGPVKLNVGEKIFLRATYDGELASEQLVGNVEWYCNDNNVIELTPTETEHPNVYENSKVAGAIITGLKSGTTIVSVKNLQTNESDTIEIEVGTDMQISIDAMANSDGVKTKHINAMSEEKLGINVTNIPENTVPEISVSFDNNDYIDAGELTEVPTIQTSETGNAKRYELPIKGLQNGKVTVTATLSGDTTLTDSAEIIIRAPRVFKNNVELPFNKAVPYNDSSNERMFVSGVDFFTLMGGTAQDNGQTLNGSYNDKAFTYVAGESSMTLNGVGGQTSIIPSKETIGDEEKIYIPLRFTAENFNGYVQWNKDEFAAYITDDERSEYITKIKEYCYKYPEGERLLHLDKQHAYEKLTNNELYLSYLFMKEFSEIDTSSLSAFMEDVTKKGIINIAALQFNGEKWQRLWELVKGIQFAPVNNQLIDDAIDDVDEIEKGKYKDALKNYMQSTKDKKLADGLFNVANTVVDTSKTTTTVAELSLSFEGSEDVINNLKTSLESFDPNAFDDYSEQADELVALFNKSNATANFSKVASSGAEIAQWSIIVVEDLTDVLNTFSTYQAYTEYQKEFEDIANNASLDPSLRAAAKELSSEVSGKIDDAISGPLDELWNDLGTQAGETGTQIVLSAIGATTLSTISAGADIANFIVNPILGLDKAIENIAYIQMWGFLQEAEVNNLKSLSAEFTKLYNNEADIDKVVEAAKKVEESYKRLCNYRLQGEETFRYLQSGEYSVIDLQSMAGTTDSVEFAQKNIDMLNEISFRD